jgi:hypothetical protein
VGWSFLNIKILHQNCDPKLAEDRSLPYTAYLVKYQPNEDEYSYDIVITNKQADIFDYYWDRYREGLISFKQTEGRVNPKLWGYKSPEEKKKKGKSSG